MTTLIDNPDEAKNFGGTDRNIILAGDADARRNRDIDPVTGLIIQNRIGDPPVPNVTVDRILVRQIEIADGQNGPFAFVSADARKNYAAGLLDPIVAALRAGTYVPVGAPKPNLPGDGPLDVHCDGTTIFVFSLVKPNDNRKFRFSRSTRAISLGGVAPGDRLNYYTLVHVADDGTTSSEPHPNKDCRIAYFTGQQTSETPYHHAFNLHLEVVYPPVGAGPEYPMPIVVDPDIRYPGGSG